MQPGGHLRAGFSTLFLRLPARSLCSSGLTGVAHRLHEPRIALGDRSRHDTRSTVLAGEPVGFLHPFQIETWCSVDNATPLFVLASSAIRCFFHGIIGLPQKENGSASRVYPANNDFSQVQFRGCRYFVMFRPPSLLAPRVVPTAANTAAGQLGLLRPGLLCFVTSAHTGYANRPNTGN
jgi:hypothetical protein